MVRVRYVLIAIVFSAALGAVERDVAASKTARAAAPSRTNITFSQSLVAEPVEPEPPPDADPFPDHGPLVSAPATRGPDAAEDVSWNFACYFSIQDENGGYWSWTYEARLFDPNNVQVASQTGFVLEKPAYQSDLRHTLTNPAAGTYTCTIDWWVNDYQLPRQQATQTISYPIPTGESTESVGWFDVIPTWHMFNGRLTGPGSFSGRTVIEQDPGGGTDQCHYPGSPYPPYNAVTGGEWIVRPNNTFGADYIGWGPGYVHHYREVERTPCVAQIPQQMRINAGGPFLLYKTNLIRSRDHADDDLERARRSTRRAPVVAVT